MKSTITLSSGRLPEGAKAAVLASWDERARRFPRGSGRLPGAWAAVQVLAETGDNAEALVVVLDVPGVAG